MALGSFCIVADKSVTKSKILYAKEDLPENILDDNTILKIRMRHQQNKLVIVYQPEFQFLSFVKQIEVKRRVVEIIGGVILARDMDSAIHQDAVEMLVGKLYDKWDSSDEEIRQILESNYDDLFDQPQLILDKKQLEERLSEKVKELNKAGKFDEANIFLKKIKKIPTKLYKSHEDGETAMKREDFDKAVRDYSNAMKYAEELEEELLIRMYNTKIRLAKKTPALLKKREKFIKSALDGLRSDNFSAAQRNFKKAAEISEQLMDTRRTEEFNLKANALAEYVKVEKKFKK